MKRCLADVNVFFPLLVEDHEHHPKAMYWFDSLEPGEAHLCRFVQLGLVRLMGNRTVMGGKAISASAAWDLIVGLMEDERVEFAAEPALIDTVLPKMFRYSEPTNRLVSDAYLAAFSIAAQMRLVTFDKGFEQFREIDLQLIRD
jgi:toxin-antitoxin system PIN domain toxin